MSFTFIKDNDKIDVPYKTFSSIDSVSAIVEDKENGIKPSFYVDEECDVKQRTTALGNTKLWNVTKSLSNLQYQRNTKVWNVTFYVKI